MSWRRRHKSKPTKPITATRPNGRSITRKGHSQKSGVVALVDPADRPCPRVCRQAGNIKVGPQNPCNQRVTRSRTRYRRSQTLSQGRAEYGAHHTVWHARGEYVNKYGYTTNHVENFFGIFKKGMVGVYHFCGEQHLQRYSERIFIPLYKPSASVPRGNVQPLPLKGTEGKRLTYRRPH